MRRGCEVPALPHARTAKRSLKSRSKSNWRPCSACRRLEVFCPPTNHGSTPRITEVPHESRKSPRITEVPTNHGSTHDKFHRIHRFGNEEPPAVERQRVGAHCAVPRQVRGRCARRRHTSAAASKYIGP